MAAEKVPGIRQLVVILLDFDPATVGPAECLRGWKEIARETGFSVDTVQDVIASLGIKLPRWGRPGPTTPVFLPKAKVIVLRRLVMCRL